MYTFSGGRESASGTVYDFNCSLLGVGTVVTGPCRLSTDGSQMEGKVSHNGGYRTVWKATRKVRTTTLPSGLYLQAGEAEVRQGKTVSIPIFLHYDGPRQGAPAPASVNFELKYDAKVAKVLPHPPSERMSPSAAAKEAPDLPRGNLLAKGILLAGNSTKSGTVLAGFAGSKGIHPGMGKPGDLYGNLLSSRRQSRR